MKRLIVCLMTFLLILSGCSAAKDTVVEMTEVQKQFEDFLTREYVDTISSDALSLHYSLKNPETYGIEQPELTLGDLGLDTIEEDEQQLHDVMKELESYSLEDLTDRQKDDWKMLHEYLEIQFRFEGLTYLQNMFSPAQSVTDALITNFTEYKFYDEQDVKDYLVLLADVPRYLDECLVFTKTQSEMGYFMTDSSVDATVGEITKFLSKEGDSALIISFESKLANAEYDTSAYFAENRRIVNDLILPAYEKVKSELNALKGTAKYESLADFEEGKDYYEALYYYKTGSSLSPSEMIVKGKERLTTVIQNYIQLMYNDSSLANRYGRVDFGDEDPEVILKNYQEKLLKSFPEGPEVTYTAEYLDPSITNDATIAYYLIPPFDYITDNVIKINPMATSGDSVTLYSTLAHEGFPGHCYQTTYYYATNPHAIRTIVENLGYTEGYAMYVEMYSFDWLLEKDPTLARFLKLDTEMNYLLQAIIDMGVNYEGWGKEGVRSLLREYGLNDSDELVDSLYNYVVQDPGLLLPYGIGLLEMNGLRMYAEGMMGKDFDEVDYHRVLLESGPMYFDLLKEKVDNWIK
ncbi:MAG: DUF885 domain-containing protein [Erysipelotrichaceae bacterium]|nr:DUF885 domain-containing protein [Erysipelotrichaceae bacterium]